MFDQGDRGMTEEPAAMSCVEFQSQIPALCEAGVDLDRHPHVLACERCRVFIGDLKRIGEVARELFGSGRNE